MDSKYVDLLNGYYFWKMDRIKIGSALVLEIISNNKITIKECIKNLCAVMFNFKYTVTGESADIVFLFDSHMCKRKDHIQAFFHITESFANKKIIICPSKKNKRIQAGNVYFYFYIIVWIWQIRSLKMPLLFKIDLLARLARGASEAARLEKIIDMERASLLVVYFDLPVHNSILIQRSKKKIHTATFQHGYFPKGSICFEELQAEYFLANSKWSKKIATESGVPPEKIVVVGMPQTIGKNAETKNNCDKKIFAVILDGPVEKSFNDELIGLSNEICEKWSMKFIIRYHPTSGMKRKYKGRYILEISKESETIDELLHRVDFILTCYSTVFLEAIYYLKPCFRYTEGRDNYKGIEACYISNIDQFQQIYDCMIKKPDDFQKFLQETREKILGDVSKENMVKKIQELAYRE